MPVGNVHSGLLPWNLKDAPQRQRPSGYPHAKVRRLPNPEGNLTRAANSHQRELRLESSPESSPWPRHSSAQDTDLPRKQLLNPQDQHIHLRPSSHHRWHPTTTLQTSSLPQSSAVTDLAADCVIRTVQQFIEPGWDIMRDEAVTIATGHPSRESASENRNDSKRSVLAVEKHNIGCLAILPTLKFLLCPSRGFPWS